MGLSGLDILVLIAIFGSGVLGFLRGFVTEVLSLFAWIAIVIALKLFHAPLAEVLAGPVGTIAGGAVLSFALITGITYFGGRMVANSIGDRTRTSIVGPIDRAAGFGFGALKGLIFASLAFLLMVLLIDTMGGGPSQRPRWMTQSKTYPMLSATSARIADMVDRRRRGEPMFGDEDGNAAAANVADAGE